SVIYKDQCLTYKGLYGRALQWAAKLREINEPGHTIVAILIGPSLEMVVAIMAILKAGAAFLPIDVEIPPARLFYMLNDSGCKLLITDKSREPGNDFEGKIVQIDEMPPPPIPGVPAKQAEPVNSPSDVIYTIYTSGTTGKPKSVVLEHKSVLNYNHWFSRKANITGKDRTLLATSIAFDLGYTVLFASLLKGGQLHMVPKTLYLSAEQLANYINRTGIT
ncbi:MAG: amino acid adenylation domain-containing protein, partial [bacterium]|nr:amino acid adenylation domain-containing protein [bacterium]